jgi:hypothetical protein
MNRKQKESYVVKRIWEDLSKEENQIESPDWHHKALRETEARLKAGQEEILDWKEAREKLKDQFE